MQRALHAAEGPIALVQWNLCFTTIDFYNNLSFDARFHITYWTLYLEIDLFFMTTCSLRPKSVEPMCGRKTQVLTISHSNQRQCLEIYTEGQLFGHTFRYTWILMILCVIYLLTVKERTVVYLLSCTKICNINGCILKTFENLIFVMNSPDNCFCCVDRIKWCR